MKAEKKEFFFLKENAKFFFHGDKKKKKKNLCGWRKKIFHVYKKVNVNSRLFLVWSVLTDKRARQIWSLNGTIGSPSRTRSTKQLPHDCRFIADRQCVCLPEHWHLQIICIYVYISSHWYRIKRQMQLCNAESSSMSSSSISDPDAWCQLRFALKAIREENSRKLNNWLFSDNCKNLGRAAWLFFLLPFSLCESLSISLSLFLEFSLLVLFYLFHVSVMIQNLTALFFLL